MKALLAVALVFAATSSSLAADDWCSNTSRVELVNGSAFVLRKDGVGSVWVAAGSIGSGIPGRVYVNPQTDETIGVVSGDTLTVTEDGATTTYTRCPAK